MGTIRNKRVEIEHDAINYILQTYPNHYWSSKNKGLIEIMVNFAELQIKKALSNGNKNKTD